MKGIIRTGTNKYSNCERNKSKGSEDIILERRPPERNSTAAQGGGRGGDGGGSLKPHPARYGWVSLKAC